MSDLHVLPAGGGAMGERIRTHAWAQTPFGAPDSWPQSLRSALSICLNSAFPTAIYWGRDYRLLYNDAWAPIPGPRHPGALGRPACEVWSDIWPVFERQLEDVRTSGRGWSTADQLLPMTRYGKVEESYFDYSLTPIAGEAGEVVGILNQGQETTDRRFADQRNTLLVRLTDLLRPVQSAAAIIDAALALLGEHLGVGRVGFGEREGDGFTIARCWTDGTMPDIAGPVREGAFGAALHSALSAGNAFTIEDTRDDPRVADHLDRYDAIGIRAGVAVPIVKQGQYSALLFVHSATPRGWSRHHEVLLTEFAERMWSEVTRARAEAALRVSEERHRLIFEQAKDIIFTADLDQCLTAVNPAGAVALSTPAEGLIGRRIAEFVSPADYARSSAMLAQKLREGGTTRYEVDVFPPDGRMLRWEVSSTLAIGEDGEALGLHAIARDVTERFAAEQSQRRLIDELNHRVKNMLAIVQGLALQSFREGRDQAESRVAFEARLTMLARAHDLLTQEKWEAVAMDDLICGVIAAPDPRFTCEGPPLRVMPKAAVSLVLALHELLTNAERFGALSRGGGQVAIHWRTADGRLMLKWQERGGPTVAPPERKGFGVRMVERALANDLGGTVRLDFAAEGLTCTIDAPIPSDAHVMLQAAQVAAS